MSELYAVADFCLIPIGTASTSVHKSSLPLSVSCPQRLTGCRGSCRMSTDPRTDRTKIQDARLWYQHRGTLV
ncbi:hypothetical protein CPB84DRAFT_1763142 [Gymnopilus junonius]|uniref:Uncharacterized protein n=1 Tax=Gymnopilus junonius TaxID=109634 RepID=A0A9P5NYX2_GYMJU|nr:hypothetical protein CPB84DRAFT_1763142 [Gymnopilus junonius]